MHCSGLSREDTLPAEDPSWSYSRVPGKPPPIPPRNEPMLYIPNVVGDSNVHATAPYLKSLQLNVRLPQAPSTTPENILYDTRTDGTTDIRVEMLTTSATDITIPDHYSGKWAMDSRVCITKHLL